MDKIYFLPLVSLPVIIDEPGEYVTRCGDVVIIERVGKGHSFNCHGRYNGDINESWHKSGRLYATSESFNDIISKAL